MADMIDNAIAKLNASDRKALFTKDGHGEFSSAVFNRLLMLGLVNHNLRFTELGRDVIERLSPTPKEQSNEQQ